MTTADTRAPSLGRRVLAVLSLLVMAAVVVAVIVFLVHNLLWLLVALAGVAVAVAGVWWVLTERMPRRAVGIAGLVAGAVVIVVAFWQAVAGTQNALLRIVVVAAALAVAVVAARAALAPDPSELDRQRAVKHVHPRKPVLLCNPWSGGGKVDEVRPRRHRQGDRRRNGLPRQGSRSRAAGSRRDRARRGLPRYGGRRRLAGTRRLDRARARHPVRVHLGGHAQPLRPRPRASTRRTRARAWSPSATASSASSTTAR